MVRHADTRMSVTRKKFVMLTDPQKQEAQQPCRATCSRTSGGQEVEGTEEDVGEGFYCGFLRKDRVRQGVQP